MDELSRALDPEPDPVPPDPFDLILWENVAYLADDGRRAEAMERLRQAVGTSPTQLLAASAEALRGVGSSGILADTSAAKLRRAAEVAVEAFDGDLSGILDLPVAKAKQALRRFPGIGEPGAEKVLLYARRHPFLAPDSNALRVLVRLGYVAEGKSYGATYAAARELAREQLGDDFDLLLRSRNLLRRHGQTTCRRATPLCEGCVLRRGCAFGSRALPQP